MVAMELLGLAIPAGTVQIASIGIPDTLFLMLLALVVFGPRRLPEIGRQIGKLMYEFRKVSNDFKYQMEEELRASEEAERQKKLQAIPPLAPVAPVLPAEPVVEATLELSAGAPASEAGDSAGPAADEATGTSAAIDDPVKEVPGEVRGGGGSAADGDQGPQILPPASGEPVAAARPFRRGKTSAAEEAFAEAGSELNADANHAGVVPVADSDAGPGTNAVQPELNAGTERKANHA